MIRKLILGTVQFGLKYGINNTAGQPNGQCVDAILNYALSQGIQILDTADVYGNASELIGDFHEGKTKKFNVITKFKNVQSREFSVEKWLNYKLSELNIDTLFGCMFHTADEYFDNPHIVNELVLLQEKSLIKYIGVSIYTNQQFETVINDSRINLIQLPYNLIDNVNRRGGLIEKAKREGKIIHVRSVFLQGLFFMELANLPAKVRALEPELELLKNLSKEYNIPMQSMALNYAILNKNVDGVLIGVDTLKQLQFNIESLGQILPNDLVVQIDKISSPHPEMLNPFNWK